MKNIKKHLLSLFVLGLVLSPMMGVVAAGKLDNASIGIDAVESSNLAIGGAVDPMTTATRLINLAMGFLGLIAVCIILLGGFKWMTAGGGEEKIEEAKKLMGAGVVGILIILSAWGIAKYVIGTIMTKVVN
jgi:hypothetical protein